MNRLHTPTNYQPTLWTANECTQACDDVLRRVAPLNETSRPYVLTNTPDILPMGCSCDDHGYFPSGRPAVLPLLFDTGGTHRDFES